MKGDQTKKRKVIKQTIGERDKKTTEKQNHTKTNVHSIAPGRKATKKRAVLTNSRKNTRKAKNRMRTAKQGSS
ncbi:hypothetical protein [Bacteroides graminisolvens]|uniref:hypothetical protein n=1 Tax=Bacteroides graminisolvens TaxID=477666 RepID=UPI00054ED74A|nr:hypothetical protein [Bacteroides graminisolvens]